MYSRHRVAGYSIDHVIKFLFFLLVPVVILDIMISCFVIFSMRSQSIQSLQDTTSLYASQIDTVHISINRYLIRLLTENDDADTLLETQDKLEFISSAERVHNNIDIFLESFEKGYQIFLYNSENERMYRPTEIFQTLTQNQLVLLNKHLIQKITAPNKNSEYTEEEKSYYEGLIKLTVMDNVTISLKPGKAHSLIGKRFNLSATDNNGDNHSSIEVEVQLDE